MAHQILIAENGIATAAFGKKAAWHGLGAFLGQLMKVHEAVHASNFMAHEVSKLPIFSNGDELADVQAVWTKSNKYIGTVSNTFEVFTNKNFIELLARIAGKNASIESLGMLEDGRVFCCLENSALPELTIAGDQYKTYLTITNCNDGSGKLSLFLTMTRVVCANTWLRAMDEVRADGSGKLYERKHTKNMHRDLGVFLNGFTKQIDNVPAVIQAEAEKIETLHARMYSKEACTNILADALGITLGQEKRNRDAEVYGLLDFCLETSETNHDEAINSDYISGKRILDATLEAMQYNAATYENARGEVKRVFTPMETAWSRENPNVAQYDYVTTGNGAKIVQKLETRLLASDNFLPRSSTYFQGYNVTETPANGEINGAAVLADIFAMQS